MKTQKQTNIDHTVALAGSALLYPGIALTANAWQFRLNERLKQFLSNNNTKSAKYSRGQKNYFQSWESTLRLNLDQSKILNYHQYLLEYYISNMQSKPAWTLSKKNADEIQIDHPAKSTLLLKWKLVWCKIGEKIS